MKKFPSLLFSFSLAAGSLLFSGCYTQLYTAAYADRAADYRRPAPPDSVLAKAGASDTLLPGQDSLERKTVIVNNYYEEGPEYRGYSSWDWDYPVLSFGFYSSRYRSYWDPYWWHQPYHRGYGHNHDRSYDHHSYGGSGEGGGGGGGGSAPERHHIFSTAPDYPSPDRGRRSEPQASPAPAPAPKSSSDDSQNRRSEEPRQEKSSSGDYHHVEKGKRK
jgi:hypothetical protein